MIENHIGTHGGVKMLIIHIIPHPDKINRDSSVDALDQTTFATNVEQSLGSKSSNQQQPNCTNPHQP